MDVKELQNLVLLGHCYKGSDHWMIHKEETGGAIGAQFVNHAMPPSLLMETAYNHSLYIVTAYFKIRAAPADWTKVINGSIRSQSTVYPAVYNVL